MKYYFWEVTNEKKIKFTIGYGISHDDGYGAESDGVDVSA